VEVKNYSALVRITSEVNFAMNAPKDTSTFPSVHLVNVTPKHQKMKFATQKTANAGAKPNMERELVSNVTMDSTTTQIVSLATVMLRVQLRKFVTKIKEIVFAKKDMAERGVINARMGGSDIPTVSLVNAPVMGQRPVMEFVNPLAGSVLVKLILVGENVINVPLDITIIQTASLAVVTVLVPMVCPALKTEFAIVRKTLLEKSAMNVLQKDSTTLSVRNVTATLMVSLKTSS